MKFLITGGAGNLDHLYDAIVTGENIFSRLQKGEDPLQASIRGTQEIAVPVTFGVLTTVVAFTPLLMIEGVRGQIFAQIPLIVIPCLLFSLVESLWILPAHLAHMGGSLEGNERSSRWYRIQVGRFSDREQAAQTIHALESKGLKPILVSR